MRPIAELAAEICTLTGHINAANHRWLMRVAEYDRRNGWSDGATQSCAHWLNWKCGIALGAARDKARGACAETEDYLLMIADHGTASHVEKLVRAYRRCQDAEELSREARQQETRSVCHRYDDDGSLILNCQLPAEAGARIMRALELAIEDVPAGTSPRPAS